MGEAPGYRIVPSSVTTCKKAPLYIKNALLINLIPREPQYEHRHIVLAAQLERAL